MKPKLPWGTIVEVKPKPGFLEPYCRGETEASWSVIVEAKPKLSWGSIVVKPKLPWDPIVEVNRSFPGALL